LTSVQNACDRRHRSLAGTAKGPSPFPGEAKASAGACADRTAAPWRGQGWSGWRYLTPTTGAGDAGRIRTSAQLLKDSTHLCKGTHKVQTEPHVMAPFSSILHLRMPRFRRRNGTRSVLGRPVATGTSSTPEPGRRGNLQLLIDLSVGLSGDRVTPLNGGGAAR